jgi:hypothetical protein
VDIDVIHPASGEMSESRESSEGGYVAIRRDDETPITKLRLRPLTGMPSAQFKLSWASGKVKLWKDEARTQAVTSDQTAFPADTETDVYLEGLEKSGAVRDVEVQLKVIIGSTVSSVVPLKLTVIQAEYDVTIQAFIPYLWIDVPGKWTPFAWDEVAIGDNRTFDPTLNRTYRSRQWFVVTPHEDLSPQRIKANSVEGDAGLSIHYDKSDSVPAANQNDPHGYSFVENPRETRRGQGTNDIPTAGNVQRIDAKRFSFQSHMAAWEGVLGQAISEPIVWNLNFGFDVTNPIQARVLMDGTRKGFPAYEVYVRDSADQNRPLYQWAPGTDRKIAPHLFWTEPVAPQGQTLELQVP